MFLLYTRHPLYVLQGKKAFETVKVRVPAPGLQGAMNEGSVKKLKWKRDAQRREEAKVYRREREDCRDSRDVQSLIASSRVATSPNKHSGTGQAGLKADRSAPAIPSPSRRCLIRPRKSALA
jgi:hypothetical protein